MPLFDSDQPFLVNLRMAVGWSGVWMCVCVNSTTCRHVAGHRQKTKSLQTVRYDHSILMHYCTLWLKNVVSCWIVNTYAKRLVTSLALSVRLFFAICYRLDTVMYFVHIYLFQALYILNVDQDVESRMMKGAILLVENLPDDVTIETVRKAFSEFGEVKWVDINKSAAEVCIVHCFCQLCASPYYVKLFAIVTFWCESLTRRDLKQNGKCWVLMEHLIYWPVGK